MENHQVEESRVVNKNQKEILWEYTRSLQYLELYERSDLKVTLLKEYENFQIRQIARGLEVFLFDKKLYLLQNHTIENFQNIKKYKIWKNGAFL